MTSLIRFCFRFPIYNYFMYRLEGFLLSFGGLPSFMCRKIFLMGHWGLRRKAGLRALILMISGFLVMSILSSTSVLGEWVRMPLFSLPSPLLDWPVDLVVAALIHGFYSVVQR